MQQPVSHGPPVPAAPTRGTRPRLPPAAVWRPRLAEQLDAGARRAVTLICAGAGWGKTVLAASWAQARAPHGQVAWLSCDAAHNDPPVFWSDLLLALRTAGTLRPDHPLPRRGPTLALDSVAFLRNLASAAAARRGQLVMVLDDLQEITDPRILDGLTLLVRRPPEGLRLVLSSRVEPDLPLHRLRAAGELTEIRFRDLAFRGDAAAQLRDQHGRSVPAARTTVLVRATEGWAAGLRLALDAPPSADPDRLAGDYLMREVLDAQSPADRELLLSTSVPDRICGPLAEELTGQRPGDHLLERLHRANLFLERVGTGGWFRYHRQFRGALRRRLAEEQVDAPRRLHRVAARWHVREGNPLIAMGHAADAGDWELVGQVVAHHGVPLFASADRAEAVALLRRIPAERLQDSAELILCAALLSYALGDLAALPRHLARARARLAAEGHRGGPSVELTSGLLDAGLVVRWQGDMPRLIEASTETLAALGRLRLDEAPAMPKLRGVALVNKGIGLLWSAQLDHADRYLWAAATGARAAGMPLIEASALGHLALLAVLQGALREAREHAVASLDVAHRIEAEDRIAAVPAHLAHAVIALQQGGETAAEEGLRRALHASGEQPEAALALSVGAFRAFLLLDQGDPRQARAVLLKGVDEAGPRLVAPLLHRIVEAAHSDIDLALGDPRPVIDRYARRSGLLPGEQLRLARAYQLAGLPDPAEQVLERVRESPDRISAVSAWILTALALDGQSRGRRAADALARALALAEPEQIRRPFRQFDAARVLVLAERQQWLTDGRSPAGEGALAEITGEIPIVGGTPSAGPLSDREIEVLQYLPTVLTAAEIAQDLGISVNTVKAHMRSIYRKLGAGRRREAVVMARQLGLL